MNKPKLLRFERRSREIEAAPPALLTEENLQKFAEQLVAFERVLNDQRSGSKASAQPSAVTLPTPLEELRGEPGSKCPLAIKSE